MSDLLLHMMAEFESWEAAAEFNIPQQSLADYAVKDRVDDLYADYLAFMKDHNLIPSMSRRGNCHDNAVAESFFATFKKRVTKRKTYSTRDEAKTEIFNFIEMFYNPIKRHTHTGGISPAKYEEAYFLESTSV